MKFSKKLIGIFAISSVFSLPVHSDVFEEISTEKKQLLISTNKNIKIPSELNILADRQYDLNNNIFVAEGNVKANFKGALITANRLEFNRKEKVILVQGNVTFQKGGQYFQASKIKYNFINNYGEINDVYGVLSIDAISKDLKFLDKTTKNTDGKIQIQNKTISKIKLKDGYQIIGGNINEKYNPLINLELKKKGINIWRIQSQKINIIPDGWIANKVSFTNDPLTPSQTRIEANNVIAKEEDGSTWISFDKSRLVLEDKISIPLLRNRKTNFGQTQKAKWLVGLDFKDRDGLFLQRQFEPINFSRNFELYLHPQYLLQRSIRGESDSYITANKSPISSKSRVKTNTADLFGLKSELNGSIDEWGLNLMTDISTFDSSRFSNGYRYRGTISKNFNLNRIEKVKASFFTSYRYKVWNGSLGETDIYKATGFSLDKNGNYRSQSGKVKNEYSIKFGIGNYEAESFFKKELVEIRKNNLFASFKTTYPIYRFKNTKNYTLPDYRYTPEPIKSGISFTSEVKTSYSIYENNYYQALIKLSAGPELKLGQFKKSFFDYTKISIMPGITIKDGGSPFKFDNDVDLRTISIQFDQQVYGPLLLSTGVEYNIDKRSNHYGKSLDSQAALIVQRRSYGFGIFYQPYQKAGGIMFTVNGFDFNESGKKFID